MPLRVAPPLACAIALAACIALLGAPPPIPPAGALADDRIEDQLVGTVEGPVVATPYGFGASLGGGMWVWTIVRVEPGDRIRVTGPLRSSRRYVNPGGEQQVGVDWEVSAMRVEMLGRDDSIDAWAWRWAGRVQRRWTASIVDGDAPARAALAGIVTGDRSRVSDDLDARWRAVGIYHVLSVSGLHLAVVAGLLFALLRRAIAASPLGRRSRPARWAAPIALSLAVVYTLVTGGQLATIRALIVVAIVMLGHMVDRPVRLVDALGCAALVILVWRPQDLFDPSFQLSFVAALTLALRPRTTGSRLRRWLVGGLASSAWVALTTAPITALHFHQVAAGGVIGNLVLTPIIELVALPLGFLPPLVPVAAWVIARVDDVAGVLAHVVPVGNIAVASPIAMTILVAFSLIALRKPRVLVLVAIVWTFARSPAANRDLRVTFLDVGQGDAAIIELPNRNVILVDAGGIANARNVEAASAPGRAVVRALEAYGHDEIDLAIISHPHPDHFLGLAAIDLPIRELWDVDSRPPPHVDLGAGVTLDVLAPRYQPVDGGPVIRAPDPVRSVNDNSLVVVLRYAGRSILFAGDLESEGEQALVDAGIGRVDVVKVAHHGSRTSSSPALVAATSPAVAVISCGVGNMFGFPAPEVVERWERAGARVERTDLRGAVTVVIGPTGTLALP